jgi:hypothetical protein
MRSGQWDKQQSRVKGEDLHKVFGEVRHTEHFRVPSISKAGGGSFDPHAEERMMRERKQWLADEKASDCGIWQG